METKLMSFRDTIILAMSEEMRRDENVLLMGEDVGVFGIPIRSFSAGICVSAYSTTWRTFVRGATAMGGP